MGLVFESDNDLKIEEVRGKVEEVAGKFISKWKDRNDYLSEPAVLKEALDEYEAWQRQYGYYDAEIFYLSLRTSQDQLDTKLKGRYNQILDKAKKLVNESQFFSLRVAKIPVGEQAKFLNFPGLAEYRHYLENLFKAAKYQLSEGEEKIMILKAASSHSSWTKMVSGFISSEKRKGKNFSEILAQLSSKEKPVRDEAGRAVNAILAKYVDVAEHELNAILANKKVDDELRGLPNPVSGRLLDDDIDEEVVEAMAAAVSSRFDLSERWYQLKAKLLGLPKLGYHERMASYGQMRDDYSYDEAVGLISKVFGQIDPEFGAIFDGFIAGGQVDVYPAKGKKGGAFCAAASLSLPTYILLNFTGRFDDICTLAHEAGHGINDELMKKKVNALNFDSPLSTAEVASTFMEDFVLSEAASRADEEARLAIMVKKLDDDVSTIFRQVAGYIFEKELHQNFRAAGYLSKKEIGKLFQKHMVAYMGNGVEQSKGSENWWVYWSHFRSFFYVYSYASGLLISKSLQAAVKNDKAFVGKVKEFLAAGSSESPKNIFAKLGIDITDGQFWENGLAETEKLLDETESLARKLGKI